MLTQMKRWGQVKGDLDYAKIAEQVFLATDARQRMTELGFEAPPENYKTRTIMGKVFDPTNPEEALL